MPVANSNENSEQNKQSMVTKPIYFSMSVPGWFSNLPDVGEKCRVIENLANELKDKKPITKQQRDELVKIK